MHYTHFETQFLHILSRMFKRFGKNSGPRDPLVTSVLWNFIKHSTLVLYYCTYLCRCLPWLMSSIFKGFLHLCRNV